MEKGKPVRALPFRQPQLARCAAPSLTNVTAGHIRWPPGSSGKTANRRHWLAAWSSATKRLTFNAGMALAGAQFATAIPGRLDRRQDCRANAVALQFADRVNGGTAGRGDGLAQQYRMLP